MARKQFSKNKKGTPDHIGAVNIKISRAHAGADLVVSIIFDVLDEDGDSIERHKYVPDGLNYLSPADQNRVIALESNVRSDAENEIFV